MHYLYIKSIQFVSNKLALSVDLKPDPDIRICLIIRVNLKCMKKSLGLGQDHIILWPKMWDNRM